MMKSKRKLKWIVIPAAVLIAVIWAATSLTAGVSAETYTVEKGEIKQYVEDTANVMSKEKQTVYIEGAGKVTDIHVQVGDAVKKGDSLLSLDKTDLELQLKDARAKVEAAKAQLKGTELVNYANKIELSKAALEQAQTAYDSVKRNFEKSKNLYEAGALSENDFKTAEDAYKSAQAALNAASLQLADVRKGTPEYVRNSYESQLEQAMIFRDTVERSLKKQEVRADIDGVILEKLVEKNSLTVSSTAAFLIGNTGNLELEAEILADDIHKIKIGNEVEISGNPLDDQVLKGEVVKIAPAAKNVISALGVNQKRVPVTIKILDGANLLKPGYSLDVKIITTVRSGIVKVPDSAVFDYQGHNSVFAVVDGKASLKKVTKGIESENNIEIVEGLKEGETILVKPGNTIKEGIRIKALK